MALSSLTREYRRGGVNALRETLGLTEYQSGTPGLTGSAEKTDRQADKDLAGDTEDIEHEELPGVANSAGRSAEQVETALTNQPSYNAAWARQELAGLQEAMTGVRDELSNNLAKLSALDDKRSEVEKHIAREHRKLTETDDAELQQEVRDRIRKLESALSNIELERQSRLEASAYRAALRS